MCISGTANGLMVQLQLVTIYGHGQAVVRFLLKMYVLRMFILIQWLRHLHNLT